MNQNITQIMAERLGLTNEEFEGIKSGDLSSIISGRLADRFSDPVTAVLIYSMLGQNSTGKEVGEERTDYKLVLTKAKQIIRKLKEQLAATDIMLNYIAEIFGACPACWGQNKLCQRCNGMGKPGCIEPNEEELLRWVEPALKKIGMRVVRFKANGSNKQN